MDINVIEKPARKIKDIVYIVGQPKYVSEKVLKYLENGWEIVNPPQLGEDSSIMQEMILYYNEDMTLDEISKDWDVETDNDKLGFDHGKENNS